MYPNKVLKKKKLKANWIVQRDLWIVSKSLIRPKNSRKKKVKNLNKLKLVLYPGLLVFFLFIYTIKMFW